MKTHTSLLNAVRTKALPARMGRLCRAVGVAAGAVSALGSARAHDLHGLTDSHWHATDVLVFVVAGGAVVAALWWSRGGK